MAYVTVEDDTGSMELLVFARVLGESGSYIKENFPVVVTGRISVRDEKAPQLMADSIQPLQQDLPLQVLKPKEEKEKKLYIRLPSESDPRWRKITLILEMFPGKEPFRAKFEDSNRWSETMPCQVHGLLLETLEELLGSENVVVKESGRGTGT